jgi:hypothetical protein
LWQQFEHQDNILLLGRMRFGRGKFFKRVQICSVQGFMVCPPSTIPQPHAGEDAENPCRVIRNPAK